ncbi:glycosyltransferase family 4 protein [Paenimyroides baculatum]|uniref:Glycosyltransferase family 4 protein n=1 Tax=Paenimyroides baculatum TaxID=2608000 RepID=A0A5M6CK26_9FLAO|nr:glycosyltransferase family 4 protein [Paenimyroides baculatum]KAA5535377.1 glycosyltransferase family 4 protein [Paenimyroides baculatum]
MKNLYILSELFYPNKTSTAYIMTEIANYLVNSYRVSVITTNIRYDGNITENVEKLEYNVIRKKVGNVDKNSFFSRIKGAVGSSFLLAFELLKNVKKGEKVLVVTNPFLIIFFIAVIRVFKKFEYNLLVHDVFPENTIPAGLKSEKSISYKLIKLVFDWSYRKADKLIVLGEDMKQLLVQKGVSDSSINIIPNWYDEDLISPDFNRSDYLGIPNLDKKVVIGFAGNIGRVQGLDDFLESFTKVSDNKLVFVAVGDGAMMKFLKEKYGDKDNIYFLGNKPRNEQSYFLNAFDISLVTLAKGMYGLGVPSKSYNILKSGKPILYIGDSSSEIDLMIRENNCGWSFNWEEKAQLTTFLTNIKSSDINEFRIKNQELAINKFNSSIIKNQFFTVINK